MLITYLSICLEPPKSEKKMQPPKFKICPPQNMQKKSQFLPFLLSYNQNFPSLFLDELVYDSLMKKSLVAAASRGSNSSITRSSGIANAGGSNLRDDENDVLSSVTCHLESTELWSKFHELGTEMIITKTGR